MNFSFAVRFITRRLNYNEELRSQDSPFAFSNLSAPSLQHVNRTTISARDLIDLPPSGGSHWSVLRLNTFNWMAAWALPVSEEALVCVCCLQSNQSCPPIWAARVLAGCRTGGGSQKSFFYCLPVHPGHRSRPWRVLERTGGWAAAGTLHISGGSPQCTLTLSYSAELSPVFSTSLALHAFPFLLWDPLSVAAMQRGMERECRRGGERSREGGCGREMLRLLA